MADRPRITGGAIVAGIGGIATHAMTSTTPATSNDRGAPNPYIGVMADAAKLVGGHANPGWMGGPRPLTIHSCSVKSQAQRGCRTDLQSVQVTRTDCKSVLRSHSIPRAFALGHPVAVNLARSASGYADGAAAATEGTHAPVLRPLLRGEHQRERAHSGNSCIALLASRE